MTRPFSYTTRSTDDLTSFRCGICGWGTEFTQLLEAENLLASHACVASPPRPPYDPLKTIWREIDEALAPENARRFDGDNNYKKCINLSAAVVGGDDGSPVFVLEAKSPRSAVNNLGCSVTWNTNDREEAAEFLRCLADRISGGGCE